MRDDRHGGNGCLQFPGCAPAPPPRLVDCLVARIAVVQPTIVTAVVQVVEIDGQPEPRLFVLDRNVSDAEAAGRLLPWG